MGPTGREREKERRGWNGEQSENQIQTCEGNHFDGLMGVFTSFNERKIKYFVNEI